MAEELNDRVAAAIKRRTWIFDDKPDRLRVIVESATEVFEDIMASRLAVLDECVAELQRERSSRQAWAEEAARVEDVLAEALSYPRSDGGPDDPNGGGYVVGEHTSASLAMEAAKELGRLRREVEVEANAETYNHDWMNFSVRPCACLPAGTELPDGWSRPVCAVHPDGPVDGGEA